MLAQALGPTGTMVLNDADPRSLERSASLVRLVPQAPRIVELQGNFAEAPRKLAEQGLVADAVLADLGFSSAQMSDAQRGLSFQNDGPLDMRFDPQSRTTASELVNTLSEQELYEILRDFGEEPRARAVARKLVEERQALPIDTTSRLASIVRSALGGGRKSGSRIDPATRTFQALRIAINDELGSLEGLLEAVSRAASGLGVEGSRAGVGARSWLARDARIGIISFHSLEDRLVKNAFRRLAQRGLASVLTKRPVTAGESELGANPRARSAKLRAIELMA